MALHKNLTGTDLHEPKGVAAVTEAGKVYVSNGLGSGTWTGDLTPISLELQTAVFKTITIPWSSMGVVDATSNADLVKHNDNGAASLGAYAAAFDATAIEQLSFDFAIPADYKAGEDLTVSLIFTVADATAGNIVWTFEYIPMLLNTVFSNTTVITETVASPAAVKSPKRCTFSSVISGTSLVPNEMCSCSISRTATSGSDTYAADVYLSSIQISYPTVTMGTAGAFA